MTIPLVNFMFWFISQVSQRVNLAIIGKPCPFEPHKNEAFPYRAGGWGWIGWREGGGGMDGLNDLWLQAKLNCYAK